MKKQKRIAVREIEVERLVLRAPGGGVCAVLETKAKPGRAARVSLRLFSSDGEPAIVATVSRNGAPRITIGHPDHGTSAVITPSAIDFWHAGNIVAALRSTDEGGELELFDVRGRKRPVSATSDGGKQS